MFCVLLTNVLYIAYGLFEENYSEEPPKTPWHPAFGPYGDLKDRAKSLKASKNDKFFYQSGYGVMDSPYYPFQYVQGYYRYPYYGEMVYQPNGFYTTAFASSSNNYLLRKEKTLPAAIY